MTAGNSLTRTAVARTGVALALLLALSACGPKKADAGAKDGGEPTAQSIVEAAADPCGTVGGAYGQALCGDPDLSPLVGQVKASLVEAAGAISTQGAQQLAQGQTQWMESTRVACGIADTKVPLTAPQEECVKSALTSRAQAAAQAVQKTGGFVFQTVEINKAQALTADAGMGPDTGIFAVTKEIRFPRIEGDSPQIKRFNDLMAQRPQYGAQDQTSEWLNYTIAYAGPELVSVRFQGSDMSVGAAHPNDSEKVVTVVMATGEPLKETDVFSAPPARWQAEITRRARRDLIRQMRALGAPAEIPDAELLDTAIKTKNWVITQDALIVVFPSESLGSRALGAFEVKIPWKDLAPLLNPNAPAPIKRV